MISAQLLASSSFSIYLAVLAAAAIAVVVLSPRLRRPHDRLETSWLDAWLKAGIIIVLVVTVTVVIPNAVLTSGPVSKMDRIVQDIIGVSFWAGGLLAVLGGMWWAHKESRI